MQLYFPPVKGIGTLKLAIAFSNSSNVGHQPQCMCFQTSFRICLRCKTYLPARSHRQGWSGQETSSKIYKTRLRLESQGVASDAFIVHRIFERKKKNQQFPTFYVPSTHYKQSQGTRRIFNPALADYHLFSFLPKNGIMKMESYPFDDKSRKLLCFCTGEII